MNNAKKQFIYVYRYLWTARDNDKICVKVLSGVPKEHQKFIDSLLKSDNVVKCSRVYMCQYDVDLLENYESIKSNNSEEKVV